MNDYVLAVVVWLVVCVPLLRYGWPGELERERRREQRRLRRLGRVDIRGRL